MGYNEFTSNRKLGFRLYRTCIETYPESQQDIKRMNFYLEIIPSIVWRCQGLQTAWALRPELLTGCGGLESPRSDRGGVPRRNCNRSLQTGKHTLKGWAEHATWRLRRQRHWRGPSGRDPVAFAHLILNVLIFGYTEKQFSRSEISHRQSCRAGVLVLGTRTRSTRVLKFWYS